MDDFRVFIKSLITNSHLLLDKNLEKLLTTFSKQKLMVKLLKCYHRKNSLTKVQHGSYDSLQFTPWLTFIGNDPQKVLYVYHQEKRNFDFCDLTPTDAQELLEGLCDHLQSLPDELKKHYLDCEHILTPIRIQGVHSFSFLPLHYSLRPIFNGKISIRDWISKSVTSPASGISQILMTNLMRTRLIKELDIELLAKKKGLFLNKLNNLPSLGTILDSRCFVAKSLKEFCSSNENYQKMLKNLDTLLIMLLPTTKKAEWEHSLIHFGDSNWSSGAYDIHYAIGVNPGSAELELIAVLENGKFHELLDQSRFFKNRLWEIGF